MKIEINKKYTSNDEAIRILCIDRPGEYPVVGMVERTGDVRYFTETGEHVVFNSKNLVEVWEPQENEWCWFWDNSSRHPVIHLRMYSGKIDNFFKSTDDCAWENCAKFIGELPEPLKNL